MLAKVILATLVGVSPAAAQFGNPAGQVPGTVHQQPGVPAPHQPNAQDRLFARQAAFGGIAEVELGKLAADKAQAAAVKEFARQMTTDHAGSNAKLRDLAKAAAIPLPSDLHPDHVVKRDRLRAATGTAFDVAYIQGQVEDHQLTVQLLQWEMGSGQDPALQQFAAETLPTVLRHLERARAIEAQLTGRAP